jgi:hypothetical protein
MPPYPAGTEIAEFTLGWHPLPMWRGDYLLYHI